MFRKSVLMTIALLCLLASYSQAQITSAVVTYELQTKLDSSASSQIPKTQTFSFNSHFVKIENNGGESVNIIDLNQKQSTIFMKMAGTNVALEIPYIDSVDVDYLNEQKSIAGFICKKAKITHKGKEDIAYLTTEIQAPYTVLGKIPAFVLEYASNTPMGQLVYSATEVSITELGDELFVAPEGYKKITPQELGELMSQSQTSQKGEHAIPFSKKDWKGNLVELSSLKDNVVVLNFWFVACKPCIKELPLLNSLVDKFLGKPVKFIAITFDDQATVEKFLKKHEFSYQIVPAASDVIQSYGINIFPTHVVIDKNGKIAKAFSETLESDAILVKAIASALRTAPLQETRK